MDKPILVIHGPNLNLLGEREPEIYGHATLETLNEEIEQYALIKGFQVICFQSNHEGALIDFIHQHRTEALGMVINPGGLTHYSIALRDAIASVALPAVEVHLSDISSREDFRKISVTRDVCIDQCSGMGKESYLRGIDRLLEHVASSR
jgi:3-dehydroquinate dehydratase-2